MVTGATARCNTELLERDVGWESLASRRRSHRLVMFYKIVNGLSPPYLNALIPRTAGARAGYALRNSKNFTVPACRLQSFSLSFFPEVIRSWNNLSSRIKDSATLYTFRRGINAHRSARNPLFYYGPRASNIILARLRIRCSNLNSHLFHYLHVIDSPSCPCGHVEEDMDHYFFHCPLYDIARQTNIAVLGDVNSADVILNGDPELPQDDNINRLALYIKYIEATQRFKRR